MAHSQPAYDRAIRLRADAPDAPPFAFFAWVDTYPDGVWEVVPPLNDDDLDVFTGPPVALTAGVEGVATDDRSRIVAYYEADGVPQPGEEWGVKRGDYYLRRGYRGFRVTQQGRNGRVAVVRLFGTARRIGSGSGSSAFSSVVQFLGGTTVTVTGCTISASAKIYQLTLNDGELSILEIGTQSSGGSLPTETVNIPTSGSVSGTITGCTLSGTVSLTTTAKTIVSCG